MISYITGGAGVILYSHSYVDGVLGAEAAS